MVTSNFLQASGFILIARPEYMLEEDIGKIIENTLSDGANGRMKVNVVHIFAFVYMFCSTLAYGYIFF